MDVLTTLVMDLTGHKTAGSSTIMAKQNDKNTRKIKILLHQGYAPWPIPAGVAAAIRYSKPDGTKGLYDQLPNGDPAVILEAGANALTLILAPQVLTAAGKVCMDVVLINRDAELATFDILVNVLPAPVTDGDLESQDYYNYSTLAELNEVIGNLDDLKTTAKSSLVAAINEAARSGGGGTKYQIGNGLKLDVKTNTLSVDTADAVERDNTKPITSAGVYLEIGNINALLATI